MRKLARTLGVFGGLIAIIYGIFYLTALSGGTYVLQFIGASGGAALVCGVMGLVGGVRVINHPVWSGKVLLLACATGALFNLILGPIYLAFWMLPAALWMAAAAFAYRSAYRKGGGGAEVPAYLRPEKPKKEKGEKPKKDKADKPKKEKPDKKKKDDDFALDDEDLDAKIKRLLGE
jgi:hypothetical protein